MTIRKRKNPTPGFRLPPPFNAMTGERADLVMRGVVSRCAMMQVIGDDETEANEDTHDNYVLCRGFDPETKKFYHSIAVAKPYSVRGSHPYRLAELFAAMKAATRLGDNCGKSSVTTGQPADLDETIDLLLDDDSKPIYWLDISGGHSAHILSGVLDDPLPAGGSATMSIWELDDGAFFSDWLTESSDTLDNVTVYAPAVMRSGNIAVGKWVECLRDDDGLWRVRWSECP
jgi:hypothetical protein